jgi:voltage-gated potassium channel
MAMHDEAAPRRGRFKPWVNRVLNDPTHSLHQPVERFIYALILLSVALLIAEFIWFPSGRIPTPLLVVDYVILAVFAVEYLARLWVVEPVLPQTVRLNARQRVFYTAAAKLGWMVQPYSLVDLAAILPLFPFLRSLRILRVLRLLTHTQLTRRIFHYFNPFSAAGQTLRANQAIYLFVLAFVVLAVGLGAITTYLSEHPVNEKFATPFDALWWASVTVTTVGYGDMYPITPGGRITAMALMFAGFFIFALMAGVVSQTLVRSLLNIREEGIRMTVMVNQILVCGWNGRTMMLLREIEEQDVTAPGRVVVFADREEPEDLPDWVTFVQGDPTQEVELSKVRMSVADTVIVVADESRGGTFSDADARALLTIFTVRAFEGKLAARGIERTRPIHIAAELLDPDNMPFFRAAGADEVIQTALVGSTLMARAAVHPETGQLFEELVSVEGHTLRRMPIPASVAVPAAFWQVASKVKHESEALVLGYERGGKRVLNPAAHTELLPGDVLLYLGADAASFGPRRVEPGKSFWGSLDRHK